MAAGGVDITVAFRGAVVSRRPEIIVRRGTEAAREAVAEEALNRVHARLDQVLQHPTGVYQSHVVTDRSTSSIAVTDSGMVYGPWLEGTGSRNQTTRFKGYRTFRTVAQEVRRDAGAIASVSAAPILRELNR